MCCPLRSVVHSEKVSGLAVCVYAFVRAGDRVAFHKAVAERTSGHTDTVCFML